MTKKQRGRPQINLEPTKIQKLAAEGLTQKQIAATLGIARSTFSDRLANIAEIKAAFEKGSSQALARVEKSLMKKAINGNVQAARFVLSTRLREIYSTRSELTGANGKDLFQKPIDKMTIGEINAEIQELNERIKHAR